MEIEKLDQEDFNALRDFIYEKSGLFFTDNKLYFVESRVKRRLTQLNMVKYRDYLNHIKLTANKEELYALYDAVTTNETSFYRNPPQIDALADRILPRVIENIKSKGQKTLKIWSAACSSGEEPYTLSMILQEKKNLWQGLLPRIYATDISYEVLELAKEGVYKEYTMRNLSDNYKKAYFLPHGSDFKVTTVVKSKVDLQYANLVDYNNYTKYRNMDIILCRNVLIYFDLKVKREIIKGFYDCLNPNGYLLIGHSESLHNVNRDFKMEHFSRALAYIKKG